MEGQRLWIGTSGWTYPSWKERFYPPRLPRSRWLAHYSTVFSTVEINGSFYGLPRESTFRTWGASVPRGFVFAVKGSRHVTHFRRLRDVAESVALVIAPARALGPHLGPILWQLPPDLEVDLERLEAFLALLPRDVQQVLEPRHPSWFTSAVEERCREAGVALCCWEMLGHEQVSPPTAPFVYLRFHGLTAKYGGTYDEAALRPWVRRCREWLDQGLEVWAFFNNDLDGHAVTDALRLRGLLGGQGPEAGDQLRLVP